MSQKEAVEAALFAAGGPVDAASLGKILGISTRKARAIVDDLVEDYKNRQTGLEIIKVQDRYVMQVRQKYSDMVRPVAPKELSPPVLRTLAMIAYHQPILQSDLVERRGNTTYDHVKILIERGLVESERQGRSRLLRTTGEFADYFGLASSDPDEIKSTIASMARRGGTSLDQWTDLPTARRGKNLREVLQFAAQARIILKPDIGMRQ